MKPKYSIVVLVALLLGSGCSLDEQIFDTPAESNYIQSEGDVTALLNGSYGVLQGANAFKFEAFKLVQLAADDLSSTVVNFNEVSQKTFSPATSFIGWAYSEIYSVINNCNWIIANVPSMDLNDLYKTRVDGEAKFLRAFCYFYLVRFFGGVPLRTEPTTIQSDFMKARASIDEVYDLIVTDLIEASEKLPLKSAASIGGLGRANRGAAHALLSLAFLTRASHQDMAGVGAEMHYQLAKDYADSVIVSGQYSLLDNYADLWDVEKEAEAYQEVIFGLEFTRDGSIGLRNSKGSDFPFRYMPNTLANVSAQGVHRTGSGQIKVQPWFHEFYTTGDYTNDYRSEVSFLSTWTGTGGATRYTFPLVPPVGAPQERQSYLNKYRDGNAIDIQNHENDWFVIRLSEVYLIRAEAENALHGPTAAAYNDFNKLRERARKANGVVRTMPQDLMPGLTQDEFRMKIFEERGLEFVGEGKRWFDLVRMKSPMGTTMYEFMFGTFLPTLPAGLPVWHGPSRSWQGGRTESSNLPSYHPRFLLFPIPVRETDLNPEIVPNPGYF
ncbi:Starch-binding associating with outer membrane [Parapedobacter composti]|uniref:Starch-binding associating with outer membrane n=1 Tax=Parapedobacter composti TaxID=623281 RepID=A0A1I1JUJ1_9SPHI|nr:RagB/SusD family nutrient uptake outer membrane protein [Parapedobacter composti]SFC51632.1 Starch-binding associating with outer membrane [Parapedobacter composti]